MATFKVGQRVKVIQCPGDTHIIGNEGRVVALVPDCVFKGADYHVRVDCGYEGYFYPYELAPLADPRADAFIASLKKLAREPASRKADATAEAK